MSITFKTEQDLWIDQLKTFGFAVQIFQQLRDNHPKAFKEYYHRDPADFRILPSDSMKEKNDKLHALISRTILKIQHMHNLIEKEGEEAVKEDDDGVGRKGAATEEEATSHVAQA